jgi:hypothetical protein
LGTRGSYEAITTLPLLRLYGNARRPAFHRNVDHDLQSEHEFY